MFGVLIVRLCEWCLCVDLRSGALSVGCFAPRPLSGIMLRCRLENMAGSQSTT